jgi:hypothetical protein
MSKPKTALSEIEILRGQHWYRLHNVYVDRLIATPERPFPPSESGCRHPELWKAASWKWFKEQGHV